MTAPRAPGSLGAAQGSVTVTAPDFQRIAQAARVFAQELEQTFSGIDRSTKKAERSLNGLGDALARLGGAVGIGAGLAGAVQLGRLVLQSDALATSYRRQEVAALSLSGSQSKLNELLRVYDKVTGGAIDKAAALADVTSLLSQGFANSGEELETFLAGVRGASLAMGKPQEFIITRLQLELLNQTGMRLNEIGLGMEEVRQRAAALRSENANLTKEAAYQRAVFEMLNQKYGALSKSAEAQATGAEKAARAWKNFQLALGQATGPAVSGALTSLAGEIGGISQRLQDVARDAGRAQRAIENMRGGGGGGPNWFTADPIGDWLRGHELGERPGEGLWMVDRPWLNAPGISSGGSIGGGSPSLRGSGGSGGGGGPIIDMAARSREIMRNSEAIADIEAQAARQRIDAITSYEQRVGEIVQQGADQRADTIRRYEQTIAREAEDFARARIRQWADLEQDIARINSDRARQEARVHSERTRQEQEWREDLDERIGGLRSDSAKRLAEIEEDAARDRERRERSHRNRLLDAAARLDAVAILQEQRRFAEETADKEAELKDRVEDEKEKLQESIAEANKAHQERLQDAREADERRLQDMREADEQRIEDMRAALAEQQQEEDEDRALRLQRLAEDHQNQLDEQARNQAQQLAQLAAAHAQRLAQIDAHAAEERKEQEAAHLAALAELGIYNAGWKAIQDARQKEALTAWDAWWREINKRFQIQGPRPQGTGFPSMLDPYTWTPQANILPPSYPLRGSVGGDARFSRSITVEKGAIVVHAAAGQSEEQIGAIVEARFLRILQEMANQ